MYVHASLFSNEVLLDTNNAHSPMDVSTDQWHMKKLFSQPLKKYCTYFNLKPNLHRKKDIKKINQKYQTKTQHSGAICFMHI